MWIVPEQLAAVCRGTAERRAWLEQLPRTVDELKDRWSLSLGAPFEGGGSCAWVAPVTRGDGSRAVLKLGMPHMEGTHELAGLRYWDGEPTVHLLDADEALNAMLLENCEPGTRLGERPEREQDVVIAGLLRRLWRKPEPPHPFRSLAVLTASWVEETTAAASQWPDAGLVREGIRLLATLSRPAADDVLLATDLHAGNVLRAQRAPWLVIDPKPFVGDRAYDATQHLLNCSDRVLRDPVGTLGRLSDLLQVDDARVRRWLFARAAAEPRDAWDEASLMLARVLA